MKIGILLTTYNSGPVLLETLASISGQIRLPDEVLIVDDGSTDGTVELCAQWASACEGRIPVRLLRNQIQHDPFAGPGPAGGRQTGIQAASPDIELIALLDHDDLMQPHHLRLFEHAYERFPDLALCFADVREFAGDQRVEDGASFFEGKGIQMVPYREDAETKLRIVQEPLHRSLVLGSYIPTAANLFRRDLALASGGFEPRVGTADDALLWMRLARMGPVGYYAEALAGKRQHEGNLSHPRYALRSAWNAHDALEAMWNERVRWALTDAEVRETEARIEELRNEIEYHASKQGWQKYQEARERLKRGWNWKSAMRAALASLQGS